MLCNLPFLVPGKDLLDASVVHRALTGSVSGTRCVVQQRRTWKHTSSTSAPSLTCGASTTTVWAAPEHLNLSSGLLSLHSHGFMWEHTSEEHFRGKAMKVLLHLSAAGEERD